MPSRNCRPSSSSLIKFLLQRLDIFFFYQGFLSARERKGSSLSLGMRKDISYDRIDQGSSIVCEVNVTVFFFYKYYKCLKRKIKTPQLTFIKTNQPKIQK